MKRRIALARIAHKELSTRHRCELLSVPRSSAYYVAKQGTDDADLMNEIREIYEPHPFKGYKRITDDLIDLGYIINHKRVYRLMKVMGLQAIYPKKRERSKTVSVPIKDSP